MRIKVEKRVKFYMRSGEKLIEFLKHIRLRENTYIPDKWLSAENTHMREERLIMVLYDKKPKHVYNNSLRHVFTRDVYEWKFITTPFHAEEDCTVVEDDADIKAFYDTLFEWEETKETILHKFMTELNQKLFEHKEDAHIVLSVSDSEVLRRYTGLELSNIHFRTGVDIVRPSFGVALEHMPQPSSLRSVNALPHDIRLFLTEFAEFHFGVREDSDHGNPFKMIASDLGIIMFSKGFLVLSDIEGATSLPTRLSRVIDDDTLLLDSMEVIHDGEIGSANYTVPDYSTSMLELLTISYNLVDVPVEINKERKELTERLLRESIGNGLGSVREDNIRKVLDQNSLTGVKGLYDIIVLPNIMQNWPDFSMEYFSPTRSPLLKAKYIATLDIAKAKHQAFCLSDDDEIERDIVCDEFYCRETNSLSFPTTYSSSEVGRAVEGISVMFPDESFPDSLDTDFYGLTLFAMFKRSHELTSYDHRYNKVCLDDNLAESVEQTSQSYTGRYKNYSNVVETAGTLANNDFWVRPFSNMLNKRLVPKYGLPFKKISHILARTLLPVNQCRDCDLYELTSSVFDDDRISFIPQTKFKSSNNDVCPYHTTDDEDKGEFGEEVKEIEKSLDGKFHISNNTSHLNNVLFVKNGDDTPPSSLLRDILDYNARPELVFLAKKSRENVNVSCEADTTDEPFMGVEIEIDKGGQNSLKSHTLLSVLTRGKPYAYSKTDGSLTNGFELITVPATLGAHMDPNTYRYKEAFATAVKLGFRAHDTSTCGIHVHINRNFFGDNRSEQLYRASLMALIMEKNWEDFVTFTRRNYSSLDSWARKKNTLYHYNQEKANKIIEGNERPDYKERQRRDFVSEYEGDKYSAINIEHEHTFEFRIFRSTLRYETYISILQFVSNFARLVKEIELDEIDDITISSIIKYRKYKELLDYVGERSQSLSIGDLGEDYNDDDYYNDDVDYGDDDDDYYEDE